MPCSWIERISIVKMTTQSNLQIQCRPYQITNCIFHRNRKKNLTICMETHKAPNSQNCLERNRAGGIMLPEFRLYYKVTIIKTVWHWHKNRHRHPWNRIESSEIQPHTYGQVIYNKNTQYRKENLLNKCF